MTNNQCANCSGNIKVGAFCSKRCEDDFKTWLLED